MTFPGPPRWVLFPDPHFSKCGPQTSNSHPWELVRNGLQICFLKLFSTLPIIYKNVAIQRTGAFCSAAQLLCDISEHLRIEAGVWGLMPWLGTQGCVTVISVL